MCVLVLFQIIKYAVKRSRPTLVSEGRANERVAAKPLLVFFYIYLNRHGKRDYETKRDKKGDLKMSKFERRIARKSGKNQDVVCINSDDFFKFIYLHLVDYRRFLVAKNPELSKYLSAQLSMQEFEEFIFEETM